MRRGLILAVVFSALLGASGARAATTEVVVTLESPSLAQAHSASRTLTSAARQRRLSLDSPESRGYLQRLAVARLAVERRVVAAIPEARVRWRYEVVLNGFAVVLPSERLGDLARIAGVAAVHPNVRYRAHLDRSPGQIGAPLLWNSDLSAAGAGLKIGIIDDGIDQSHPFFDPRGYSFPPGFPKGQPAFATAKVIVARAFPPPTPAWRHANKPFDPDQSEHATHVAGIAAGNNGTTAVGTRVSGVAPRAYLGNYKVLTIPTDANVGLDGNAAEIAAGIEAAVRDGMDVINLSLGEPEIEPSRDVVVRAINGAAQAGVVPAIAAGNDFSEFGRGSVSSPGSSSAAITAAAVTSPRGVANVVAGFSSGGPTPISLQLKPEVSAPGVSILSSVPRRDGTWAIFSGTSMAAPHVAGAAALLRQRHPSWTVEQLKSALVLTGRPAFTDTSRSTEAPASREGGGIVDLLAANDPKLFARPATLSFGLLPPGSTAATTVRLDDAGDGSGSWSAALELQGAPAGTTVEVPPSISVPGFFTVTVRAGTAEGDLNGFVVLSRSGVRRRLPVWFRVSRPHLRQPERLLRRTGTYRATNAGRPAAVDRYRYPEEAPGIPIVLRGPEQLFRVQLRRTVANFGVAILGQARGVAIEPRVVSRTDENRLVGYPGLPLDLNPYRVSFLRPARVVGAIRPAPGNYAIVFDSVSRARGGRFTFRFWINDTVPPRVRVPARASRGVLVVRATDAGAGVDPASVRASVDGSSVPARYARRTGRLLIAVGGLRRGRHRLVLQVSDYQEAKNMEDVLRILPNTRRIRTTFVVR